MKHLDLNFDWRYKSDFQNDYLKNGFEDNGFSLVDIPHNTVDIPYNYFDEKIYQTLSCYRKKFVCPAEWENKSIILTFEAVAHEASVYINGVSVAIHKGGYTAFSIDISDSVIVGQENNIVVKVDSTENPKIPPFGNVVDYLCYGGIYREVHIDVYEKNHISNAKIVPFDVLANPSVKIGLEFSAVALADVKVTISRKDTRIDEFIISAKGEKNIEFKKPIKGIELWDIESPALYTVELEYNKDIYIYNIGFREAVFKRNGFYLNGRRVGIIGLNRHQSYPYVGYALPKSAQEADADLLKSLGVNMARTSHYPNSKHFLNRCDELGLLVFTEIPGWQFVSEDKEWRETFLNNVREMISENFHHPSIVLWGVRINESKDDAELYKESNKIAHEMDGSRQTAGVRCFPRSQLLEDVYTFNDFTYSGGKRKLMPKFIVTNFNKPLLITEHNGHMFPTKSFDHEQKRQEHALRHAAVLNESLRGKNRCGAIGWCMSDYNTHKEFGSGDKICYHGVTDMFRIDKEAAQAYRSQQDNYAVLSVASSMEIGDVAGGNIGKTVIFTNCDTIDMYKNGNLISTLDINKLSKQSLYKALPHPPIFLRDTIGNQIEKYNEYNFTKKDCDLLKKFLLKIKEYGAVSAVIRMPLGVLKLIVKYKLGIATLTDMFGKYVTNWGGESNSYRFVGKRGDETVVVEKACCTKAHIQAAADKTSLIENETYDVTRVELKAVSQAGARLFYSNHVVNVEAEGPIEIIGGKTFALIGGARAFWIRTKGIEGNAKVTVSSEIGNETINFTVKKN